MVLRIKGECNFFQPRTLVEVMQLLQCFEFMIGLLIIYIRCHVWLIICVHIKIENQYFNMPLSLLISLITKCEHKF